MPTLSHGSDLRLAPTIRPIVVHAAGSPRRALQLIAECGFAAVQLDATLPGIRPRELDISARRDLAATAMRAGLMIAGIDFLIPAEHYSDPANSDRAADAANAACSLAADLGRCPVTLNLPTTEAEPALIHTLIQSADALGVPLVIASEGSEQAAAWIAQHSGAQLALAIDPAASLITRRDPVQQAQTHAAVLGVARLSDAKRGQSDSRTSVGHGDLDLLAYRVAVDLAKPRYGPVVLDLRGLPGAIDAAKAGKTAWDNAAVNL